MEAGELNKTWIELDENELELIKDYLVDYMELARNSNTLGTRYLWKVREEKVIEFIAVLDARLYKVRNE